MQRVLPARADDAERRIANAAVRIGAEGDGEEQRSIARVAIEEETVVVVAIAAARMQQRLGRLVDRMIVEEVQHRSSCVGAASASRDFFEQRPGRQPRDIADGLGSQMRTERWPRDVRRSRPARPVFLDAGG